MSANSPPPNMVLPVALPRMVPAVSGTRYSIAYNHHNVPQTHNPQRRQLPEEGCQEVTWNRSHSRGDLSEK